MDVEALHELHYQMITLGKVTRGAALQPDATPHRFLSAIMRAFIRMHGQQAGRPDREQPSNHLPRLQGVELLVQAKAATGRTTRTENRQKPIETDGADIDEVSVS